MKTWIIIVALLGGLSMGCTDHRCSITIPSEFHTEEITPSHTRWIESLVTNLGHEGREYVFMLTDIPLKVDTLTLEECVYRCTTDSIPQFLVYTPTEAELEPVIIDIGIEEIGTQGGPSSLHPHPDGKMIVCLAPKRYGSILNVVLSDDKTEVPAPVFRGSRVYWTYH